MPDRRRLLALTALGLGGAVALWATADTEPSEPREAARTPASPAARSVATRAPISPPPALAPASAASAVATAQGGYLTDRLLVQAIDGEALDELADDYGVDILSPPGRAGFASLAVPEDWTAAAFRAELVEGLAGVNLF